MKKLVNGNTQPITQLLDGRDSRTVVSAANDVIYSRLCHTANTAKLVDGNVAFLTQLDNSQPDSLTYGHGHHLFLSKMIPICY